MRKHSETAWGIASNYSHALASDTRTLAAQIDDALNAERKACAGIAEKYPSGACKRDSTGQKIAKLILEK